MDALKVSVYERYCQCHISSGVLLRTDLLDWSVCVFEIERFETRFLVSNFVENGELVQSVYRVDVWLSVSSRLVIFIK